MRDEVGRRFGAGSVESRETDGAELDNDIARRRIEDDVGVGSVDDDIRLVVLLERDIALVEVYIQRVH